MILTVVILNPFRFEYFDFDYDIWKSEVQKVSGGTQTSDVVFVEYFLNIKANLQYNFLDGRRPTPLH